MTAIQRLFAALKEAPYENKVQKIEKVYAAEELYGSLVLQAAVICLAIYLIRMKRWSRFEWTIIVCMFLKCSLYELSSSETIFEWSVSGSTLSVVFCLLEVSLEPICHYIYASQYIKTCFLTKDIVKRAILLF